MPTVYRSSSNTGGEALVSSRAVPVPAGAQAGDVAVVGLARWEVANPAITAPAGFTQLTQVVSGNSKLAIFWKRLTSAETGSWTFSWSGTQYSLAQAILITGALASGDPIGTAFNTAAGTGTTVPTTSVSATDPFLAHFAYSSSVGSGTPPTGFIEIQDQDALRTNYRIPASSGAHTASGATGPNATLLAALVAVAPEPAANTGAFFTVL